MFGVFASLFSFSLLLRCISEFSPSQSSARHVCIARERHGVAAAISRKALIPLSPSFVLLFCFCFRFDTQQGNNFVFSNSDITSTSTRAVVRFKRVDKME
jgi:hypothetical protein